MSMFMGDAVYEAVMKRLGELDETDPFENLLNYNLRKVSTSIYIIIIHSLCIILILRHIIRSTDISTHAYQTCHIKNIISLCYSILFRSINK